MTPRVTTVIENFDRKSNGSADQAIFIFFFYFRSTSMFFIATPLSLTLTLTLSSSLVLATSVAEWVSKASPILVHSIVPHALSAQCMPFWRDAVIVEYQHVDSDQLAASNLPTDLDPRRTVTTATTTATIATTATTTTTSGTDALTASLDSMAYIVPTGIAMPSTVFVEPFTEHHINMMAHCFVEFLNLPIGGFIMKPSVVAGAGSRAGGRFPRHCHHTYRSRLIYPKMVRFPGDTLHLGRASTIRRNQFLAGVYLNAVVPGKLNEELFRIVRSIAATTLDVYLEVVESAHRTGLSSYGLKPVLGARTHPGLVQELASRRRWVALDALLDFYPQLFQESVVDFLASEVSGSQDVSAHQFLLRAMCAVYTRNHHQPQRLESSTGSGGLVDSSRISSRVFGEVMQVVHLTATATTATATASTSTSRGGDLTTTMAATHRALLRCRPLLDQDARSTVLLFAANSGQEGLVTCVLTALDPGATGNAFPELPSIWSQLTRLPVTQEALESVRKHYPWLLMDDSRNRLEPPAVGSLLLHEPSSGGGGYGGNAGGAQSEAASLWSASPSHADSSPIMDPSMQQHGFALLQHGGAAAALPRRVALLGGQQQLNVVYPSTTTSELLGGGSSDLPNLPGLRPPSYPFESVWSAPSSLNNMVVLSPLPPRSHSAATLSTTRNDDDHHDVVTTTTTTWGSLLNLGEWKQQQQLREPKLAFVQHDAPSLMATAATTAPPPPPTTSVSDAGGVLPAALQAATISDTILETVVLLENHGYSVRSLFSDDGGQVNNETFLKFALELMAKQMSARLLPLSVVTNQQQPQPQQQNDDGLSGFDRLLLGLLRALAADPKYGVTDEARALVREI